MQRTWLFVIIIVADVVISLVRLLVADTNTAAAMAAASMSQAIITTLALAIANTNTDTQIIMLCDFRERR